MNMTTKQHEATVENQIPGRGAVVASKAETKSEAPKADAKGEAPKVDAPKVAPSGTKEEKPEKVGRTPRKGTEKAPEPAPVVFDTRLTQLMKDEVLRELTAALKSSKVAVNAEEPAVTNAAYNSLGFAFSFGLGDEVLASMQKALETVMAHAGVAVEALTFTEPRVDIDLVLRDKDGRPVPRMVSLWHERAKEFEIPEEWLGRFIYVPGEDPESDLDPQYPFEYRVVGLRTSARKTPIAVEFSDPLGDLSIVWYGKDELKAILEDKVASNRQAAEAAWKKASPAPLVKIMLEARAKASKENADVDAIWDEAWAAWEKIKAAAGKKSSAA